VPIAALTPPLTMEEVDAYFVVGTPNGTAWSLLTDPEKAVAIEQATYWFETLEWNGEPADPEQTGKLPRIGVTCNGVTATADALPATVGAAFCELALALHRNPGAMVGATAQSGITGTTKRERIEGAVDVEYFEPMGYMTTGAKASDPAIIRAFPWLRDMLKCWVSFGDDCNIPFGR
jgi:hypothetical protein